MQWFELKTKGQKDFEALVDSEAWTTPAAVLGSSPCKLPFDLMCSGYGLKAKADVCNQGGSACAYFSVSSCTDDVSCTTEKKPCCKSLARENKAFFERMCAGICQTFLGPGCGFEDQEGVL